MGSDHQSKTGGILSLKYYTETYSKKLYDVLRPYKLPDYRWTIPRFLTSEDSILGFLQGLFDAEGHVSTGGKDVGVIGLTSKHKENLTQIQPILSKIGIRSFICRHSPGHRLNIHDKLSKERFASLIGFKLINKMKTLKMDLKKYRRFCRPPSVINELVPKMVVLRKQGFTVEQIARLTGIPTMTVWRRLSSMDGYHRYHRPDGRKARLLAQAPASIEKQNQECYPDTTK